MNQPSDAAVRAVRLLTARAETVAVAESLTGGLACSALIDVPGASAAVRGGVVAYATVLKHELLGVDAGLLATRGAVHPEVAVAMAEGVRARLGADWGCGTTGVAGPDPQDGVPPGRAYIAVAGPRVSVVRELDLAGDRAAVRASATGLTVALLVEVLSATPDSDVIR